MTMEEIKLLEQLKELILENHNCPKCGKNAINATALKSTPAVFSNLTQPPISYSDVTFLCECFEIYDVRVRVS